MPQKKSLAMSAREKAGLRGPVRECTEERTRPAFPGFPEAKFTNATEYDMEGRIVKTVAINPDGSKWISSNVYDDQGRLAKTISGKADGLSTKRSITTMKKAGLSTIPDGAPPAAKRRVLNMTSRAARRG